MKTYLHLAAVSILLLAFNSGIQAQTPDPAVGAPDPTSQNLAGILVRSPFLLVPTDSPSIPADAPLEEIKSYHGAKDGLSIDISMIRYKAGIPVDINGAIEGSIGAISKLEGVTNVEQKVEDVQIADATAKRLHFKADRYGKVLRVEALFILKGQTLWILQALFEGSNQGAATKAEDILKSISISSQDPITSPKPGENTVNLGKGLVPPDQEATGKIQGKWFLTKDHPMGVKNGEFIFNADGTFTSFAVFMTQDKELRIDVDGKWKIENGVLIEEVTKSSKVEAVPLGAISKDTILNLTEKEYRYRTEDGGEEYQLRELPPSP